jgi:hypothetical protein
MNFAKTALAVLFALAPAAIRSPAPPHAEQANRQPSVKLKSPATVILAGECGEGETLNRSCTATTEPRVAVSGDASDPDGDALRYTFTATGGRVSGSGPNATLDLAGLPPGYYTVTVTVEDGRGGVSSDSARIEVARCNCPAGVFTPLPCPTVAVSCPDTGRPGTPATFTANVSGGDPNVTPTFNWTVSAGTISSGQGTSSITVDTQGMSDRAFTATVDVGGYDRACLTSASCSLLNEPPMQPRKIDEYGDAAVGDEKARLDNYAAELLNDPTAQGYLLCYGGRRGGANEARRRCVRAKDYLVSGHGMDPARIVTVDGGRREEPAVELWVVPSGATPPPSSPTVDPRSPAASHAPQTPRPRPALTNASDRVVSF